MVDVDPDDAELDRDRRHGQVGVTLGDRPHGFEHRLELDFALRHPGRPYRFGRDRAQRGRRELVGDVTVTEHSLVHGYERAAREKSAPIHMLHSIGGWRVEDAFALASDM